MTTLAAAGNRAGAPRASRDAEIRAQPARIPATMIPRSSSNCVAATEHSITAIQRGPMAQASRATPMSQVNLIQP